MVYAAYPPCARMEAEGLRMRRPHRARLGNGVCAIIARPGGGRAMSLCARVVAGTNYCVETLPMSLVDDHGQLIEVQPIYTLVH